MIKRIILVVAAAVVFIVPAAAQASLDASLTKQVPSTKCTITKVVVAVGQAAATGGCKNSNGKAVAVKWTRKLLIKGVDGYPCGLTLAQGNTNHVSFVPPAPSSVSVTFTVKPKKGAGSVSKTVMKHNSSIDICESPTQVLAGAENPAYCTVRSAPTFLGGNYVIPPIACPTSWGCKWIVTRVQPTFLAGYNFWGLGKVMCAGAPPGQTAHYSASTELDIHLSPGGKSGCFGSYYFLNRFAVPASWGKYIRFEFYVDTLIPGASSDGSTFHQLTSAPGPDPQWITLSGSSDAACSLKGWFHETY